MTLHDAVLFANEAFYLAFRTRDVAAMEDVWASRVPVTCIHPGWPPLYGRAEVLESWRGILGAQGSPEIICHAPRAHVYGDVATVICYERVPDSYLIATNVFTREGGLWKLVHHQAGPTSGAPEASQEVEPRPVN